MRQTALFAAAAVVLVALTGGVLALLFPAAADRRAIAVSAGLALLVQLVAFAAMRLGTRNVMAGWGIGIALRFVTLAVYALVIVKAFALPATAALVSLVAFFFVSTLIEPLLLNP